MTFADLVNHFSIEENLPIPVDGVIGWIKSNTEHKYIKLYPVRRDHKSYRGAFVRTAMPSTHAYNTNPETLYRVIYGADMEESWQRLVILKELLHVFDRPEHRVKTEEDLKKLVSAIIAPELKATTFAPATNDQMGPFRALMILLPKNSRDKLRQAVTDGLRTIEEVAEYCKLPPSYVDIWLQHGDEITEIVLRTS